MKFFLLQGKQPKSSILEKLIGRVCKFFFMFVINQVLVELIFSTSFLFSPVLLISTAHGSYVQHLVNQYIDLKI